MDFRSSRAAATPHALAPKCADKGDDVDESSATTYNALHKERHLVERMCEYFNHIHRVATRYDKTALTFLSFVQVAASYVWLKNGDRTNSPREIL
ncbi:MAG: hypothetical protein E8D49_00855 [Nitrospira sp.]|nr:MAG: hypothetical protein E8D49_00855 [Nitrospira sp.]